MGIGSAREGNGTLALAGASATVVERNENRIGLIISNIGAAVATLTFAEGNNIAPTATATTGAGLPVGGSIVLMGADCFTGQIKAFGTTTLGFVEF